MVVVSVLHVDGLLVEELILRVGGAVSGVEVVAGVGEGVVVEVGPGNETQGVTVEEVVVVMVGVGVRTRVGLEVQVGAGSVGALALVFSSCLGDPEAGNSNPFSVFGSPIAREKRFSSLHTD